MKRLLRALFSGTSRLPYGSAARGVDPSAVRPEQRAEPTTLIYRPDEESEREK